MPKKKLSLEQKKEIFRQMMVEIGRKGGQVKGPSKARDPEKMREAQKKSIEARRRKKSAED